MSRQLDLTLAGGQAINPGERIGDLAPSSGELDSGSTLPPGPYSIGLTRWLGGDDQQHEGLPFTVRCGDGRAIAGHVPSRDIAEAIADALNARERRQ